MCWSNNKKSKGIQHGQRRLVRSYSVVSPVWLSCVGASISILHEMGRCKSLSLHVCFTCTSRSRLEASQRSSVV